MINFSDFFLLNELSRLKEENKKLKNAPSQGGRLLISYGLQREFVLTD